MLKGLAWTSLQGMMSHLISFLVFLVLARLLGPESFGLVAIATVAIAFFKLFSYFGFSAAIIQRKKLDDEHLDTAFWADIAANGVMLLIVYFSAEWIAEFYQEERLEPVIQALSLTFLIRALGQVQTSLLKKKLDFKSLAKRTLIAEALGGVVGVWMAVEGFGVWSLVAREIMRALFATMILWLLSDWRPGLKISYKHLKDLFGFSINMMGGHIVEFLGRRSDALLIGYFLGPVALGYYTIAYRLVYVFIELLGGTINRVAWPAFASIKDNAQRVENGFYKASQIVTIVVFPVFVGICSISPELVPVIYGEQWQQSIPVLKVLAFMGLIRSLTKLYDTLIVSTGRSDVWFILKGVISITNFLVFFLVVREGLVAVAIASVAVSVCYLPVYYVLLSKFVNVKITKILRLMLAPCFASLMMCFVVLGLKGYGFSMLSPVNELIILIVIGALAYASVLFFSAKDEVLGMVRSVSTVFPKYGC